MNARKLEPAPTVAMPRRRHRCDTQVRPSPADDEPTRPYGPRELAVIAQNQAPTRPTPMADETRGPRAATADVAPPGGAGSPVLTATEIGVPLDASDESTAGPEPTSARHADVPTRPSRLRTTLLLVPLLVAVAFIAIRAGLSAEATAESTEQSVEASAQSAEPPIAPPPPQASRRKAHAPSEATPRQGEAVATDPNTASAHLAAGDYAAARAAYAQLASQHPDAEIYAVIARVLEQRLRTRCHGTTPRPNDCPEVTP